MPKNTHGGVSDRNVPGYYEPGRSYHSPNVHEEPKPEEAPAPEPKPERQRRTASTRKR